MLRVLVPNKLYCIPNLLTDAECALWRARTDAIIPAHQTSVPRFDGRLPPSDAQSFFWPRLKKYAPQLRSKKAYACSTHLPVVKYNSTDQGIRSHRDPIVHRDECFGVIIYLNDAYAPRGKTTFYDMTGRSEHPQTAITPQSGMAVLFAMDMVHAAEPAKGIKYIVCPRLCYR